MNSDRAQTLIDQAKKHGWCMGAEVGVLYGETTAALLKAIPTLRMYGIDHWTAQPPVTKNEVTGEATYSDQRMLDNAEAFANATATLFGGRMQLIRGRSVKVRLPEPVDFVFIDADHQTASVIADYQHFLPYARHAMLGHDANWPSVQAALKELGVEYVTLPGNVWMVDL